MYIMQSICPFKHVTIVDLDMDYYTDKDSKEYYLIRLPWELYWYNIPPMGILVAADIFQSAIGTLFQDLECIIIFIKNIMMLSSINFKEHLRNVDEVLAHLNT